MRLGVQRVFGRRRIAACRTVAVAGSTVRRGIGVGLQIVAIGFGNHRRILRHRLLSAGDGHRRGNDLRGIDVAGAVQRRDELSAQRVSAVLVGRHGGLNGQHCGFLRHAPVRCRAHGGKITGLGRIAIQVKNAFLRSWAIAETAVTHGDAAGILGQRHAHRRLQLDAEHTQRFPLRRCDRNGVGHGGGITADLCLGRGNRQLRRAGDRPGVGRYHQQRQQQRRGQRQHQAFGHTFHKHSLSCSPSARKGVVCPLYHIHSPLARRITGQRSWPLPRPQ